MDSSAESSSASPLVSVILTTRNRAGLLARAVASVQAQSEQNLELIVVDDASEDGTASYLEKLTVQYPRTRVLRNPLPLGGGGARNAGIAISRGRWVAFLDDDDEWLPEKLQAQLRVLATAADAVACSCGYLSRSASGACRTMRVPERASLEQLLTGNVLGGASMCLCSSAVLKEMGGFDQRLASGQDIDLWIRLRMRGSVVARAEPLVVHRAHAGPRITADMRAQYLGARRLHFKHRHLMDRGQRRHRVSFSCYIMSRQPTRTLHHRVRYLVLSIRSAPQSAPSYLKGSLSGLLRDALRESFAPIRARRARASER